MKKHWDADNVVSFASLRSAYESTMEAMTFPQVRPDIRYLELVLSYNIVGYFVCNDCRRTMFYCTRKNCIIFTFPISKACGKLRKNRLFR